MIIAVLVLSMFGYGIYGAYQQEAKDAKTGFKCESDKVTKCRGFNKTQGFGKPENTDDDDFDSLTDDDFVMRGPAIVIERAPATLHKPKAKR